jgi:signal transduction histidine kinase
MTVRTVLKAKYREIHAAEPSRDVDWSSTRAILDALPLACAAFLDTDERLIACNMHYKEAFSELSGYDHRSKLFDALRLNSKIRCAFNGGDTIEARAPHSGRDYEFCCRTTDHGGFRLSVLTATDISARKDALDSHKQQQERLFFTSRMMSVGEMATTLAHELNQPLAAIVNYLNGSLRSIDRDGISISPQVQRALLAARTQAEHASEVISHIREFVRAREPRRDSQSMTVIISTVLDLLSPEYERTQLKIIVSTEKNLPEVFADRVMIEQVLLNLVKNALEAMLDTPESLRDLRIESRLNLEGDVEIQVHDRGTGLSPRDQDQLFSPFFTTKIDGLGIGLSICRSIIEYHQGRLFFVPRDGGGSTFSFTLPVASAQYDMDETRRIDAERVD